MPTFGNFGGDLGRGVARVSVPGNDHAPPKINIRSRVGRRTYQTIPGITRDAAGAPLGGCTVDLFRTLDDTWVGRTVSGPDGWWAIGGISDPNAGPYYAVAYLPGTPDVAGTTVATLQAV